MTVPRRYLALGDSYTIGEGIAAEDRWPVQLADALRGAGIALDAPEIIATTGWTTDELDAAIDAAAPVGPFDLVSLLIGVNDQYRGRDVALYGPAFSALLARAIGFAGGNAARVFVLAIPDWGVTPFGAHSGRDVAAIARELDAYNAAAAAICAARGVAFVDIAAVSRAHGGEADMLADDGLHPSAALHTEWMQLALPVARGLLSRA
ncbi:GDSL-type esterase/lipase family protein [Luteimonas sp. SMYT11W]|uniref:GDSL-type esterase/lipase family protein n=1 Tax=Luteimonas flava TaxID=3115822 RepID=A0ABU7WHA8_9GAMM